MESPQLITVRPIQRPQYKDDHIGSFAEWFNDNALLLSNYYSELEETEPLRDYMHWCMTQHDIQSWLPLFEQEDPTPWCSGCGARHQKDCDCGPIANNE